MRLPSFPLWFVDFFGALAMIVVGFLCVWKAKRLQKTDPQNVLWTYLVWLCYALAIFAVSRSVGHIVQHLLVMAGRRDRWILLQPVSGSLNTITFVVVAAITLFFERVWSIYKRIVAGQEALRDAHEKLVFFNRHLEDLVYKRTQALHLSERKYRRLFEASYDVIAVIAADGRILDMNPAGFRLFGWSLDDVGRATITTIFSRDGRMEEAWRRIRAGEVVSNWECTVRHPREESREFIVLVSGVREINGMERYIFWLHDVTARKSMERQMVQADKLSSIGRLASGVAHEINNPLGIILGYTQLLLRDEREGTDRYEDLKTIEKHARMCKTIVGDLLKFARMAPTQKQHGDIHEVLDGTLAILGHQLESDGITVVREYDKPMPAMIMDTNKMTQVFLNILMNARDAMGKQAGRVCVRTKREAGWCVVEIEDSGQGIPAEHRGKIFDPFFTTKPPGEGTGLGLSVSYGIVTDHGGTIQVEHAPQGGAVFVLRLPLVSSCGESVGDGDG